MTTENEPGEGPHYINRWSYKVYVIAEWRESPPLALFLSLQEAEKALKEDYKEGVVLEHVIDSLGFCHILTKDRGGPAVFYHCACPTHKGEEKLQRAVCSICGEIAGGQTGRNEDG